MGKFNLTEADLKAGLLDGEFLEIKTDMGPRYQWMEDSSTIKHGDRSGFGWSMEREGDKKDVAKVNQMIMDGRATLVQGVCTAKLHFSIQ